jgi:hypothetical protein
MSKLPLTTRCRVPHPNRLRTPGSDPETKIPQKVQRDCRSVETPSFEMARLDAVPSPPCPPLPPPIPRRPQPRLPLTTAPARRSDRIAIGPSLFIHHDTGSCRYPKAAPHLRQPAKRQPRTTPGRRLPRQSHSGWTESTPPAPRSLPVSVTFPLSAILGAF